MGNHGVRLAGLLLLAACGSGPAPGGAGDAEVPASGLASLEPIPGCYTADIGTWTPLHEPSRHQLPPAVFELREEIGEGMFEAGKTVVRPVAGEDDQRHAYWTRPVPDSLTVTWTTGYEGVRLRLAADAGRAASEGDPAGQGDGTARWTGMATAFTDVVVVGRPTPTAPVRVRRVPCP